MILHKINEDYKAAFKAKDTVKVSVLRTLKGELSRGNEKAENLSDSKIVSIIKRLIKSSKDSYAFRPDDKLLDEIKILEGYLPQELDKAAIRAVVEASMAELNISSMKDMGRLMKHLTEKYGATIDKSYASSIVKDILSS